MEVPALRTAIPVTVCVFSLLRETRVPLRWAGSGSSWPMGELPVGEPRGPRLCTFAGPGGEVCAGGVLAIVCSRSGGSGRPHGCGKSPKVFSFCRAHGGEGQATDPR
jgi:hypothetical protein